MLGGKYNNSKEKNEQDEHAERLARQRKNGQKAWKGEADEEKHDRLAKQRAAYKKKSKECAGEVSEKRTKER